METSKIQTDFPPDVISCIFISPEHLTLLKGSLVSVLSFYFEAYEINKLN